MNSTYVHTRADFEALYLAFPAATVVLQLAVFDGNGITTWTFFPNLSLLNTDLIVTRTSNLVLLICFTCDEINLNGRRISDVIRYLIGKSCFQQMLPHQLKFSISWNERDCSIWIELSQVNTLMKYHISERNLFKSSWSLWPWNEFVI